MSRETDILDRWESGQSKKAIASALSVDRCYVDRVVTMYGHSPATDARYERKVRAASQALAAACIATGSRFR